MSWQGQGQVVLHGVKSFETKTRDPPSQRQFLRASIFFLSFHSTTAMAQIRGTAGYHLGNQSPFGNAGRTDDTRNDPSPLDQLRAQTNKIEDFLDTMSEPLKP
jgi:hypothetical protein